jgi:hypothetical protein
MRKTSARSPDPARIFYFCNFPPILAEQLNHQQKSLRQINKTDCRFAVKYPHIDVTNKMTPIYSMCGVESFGTRKALKAQEMDVPAP